MTRGFFKSADLSARPERLVPRCRSCGLHKACRSPRMPVTGEGRRRVLVVAEAPGEREDEQGTQLVGRTGKHFRKFLDQVDLDRDCWKTNALICHQKGNPKPTERQIEHCRPNLMKTIQELEPEVIILLGAVAVKSLIGWLWKPDVGPIGRWVGWRIPCRKPNAWICPTWHPSYLMREENPVLDLWFSRHLEAAFALEGRPWPDGPPDYGRRVQTVHNPLEAARLIHACMCREGPIAFDLETNMLKPDSPDARIVSCAVCWPGGYTLAYPWRPETALATGELLRSPVKKMAANMKFEHRWIKAMLGFDVKGWMWDTMVQAHVLDNRPRITSLTFQVFARLGQRPYDAAVEPYLKADGGNVQNRVHEIDMGKLLRYNGMDAVCEREIAMLQMKEMGI